jgi:hypothetical protein
VVTPRTGRRRGAPKKHFFDDEARHLIALIDALMFSLGLSFEHAALLAACVENHASKVVPKRATRTRHKEHLSAGWHMVILQRVLPRQADVAHRVNTFRNKWNNLAGDETERARRWRANMQRAWIAQLSLGPGHERIVVEFVKASGEGADASNFMRTACEYLAAVLTEKPAT